MKNLCKLLTISSIFMSSSIFPMLSNLKHNAQLVSVMHHRLISNANKPMVTVINDQIISCDNRIHAAALKAANNKNWEKAKDLFEMAYIYKQDGVIKSNQNYEAAQDAVIAGKFRLAKDLLDQGLQIFKE